MFRLTQLMGKNAVVLADACDLGQIQGFVWNKTQNCLVAKTSKGYKKLSGLFTVNDALSCQDCCDSEGELFLLFDISVYDTQGRFLSTLCDIIVDGDCAIKKLVLTDGTVLNASKIFRIGDIVLVKAALPKKPKEKKEKSQRLQKKTAQASDSLFNIPRQCGDFSFLIGRTCKKTITNFQGEVMIRGETVINKDILREAKISGKLIELALNT